MKHRDTRVYALCQHLRAAIDLWQEIATAPYQAPERSEAPPSAPPPPVPTPILPPEKIAYTIKEATAAIGLGRSTLWKAIRDKKLAAIKVGNRTLILADALRSWLHAMPAKR